MTPRSTSPTHSRFGISQKAGEYLNPNLCRQFRSELFLQGQHPRLASSTSHLRTPSRIHFGQRAVSRISSAESGLTVWSEFGIIISSEHFGPEPEHSQVRLSFLYKLS